MAAGSRVPSSRQLARDLGVSRMTVLNAYAELEADGLIGTRPGGGTYVLPLWRTPSDLPTARPLSPEWQDGLPRGTTTRLRLIEDAMRLISIEGTEELEAMVMLLYLCVLGWAAAPFRRGCEDDFLRRERLLAIHGPSWNHPAQQWARR